MNKTLDFYKAVINAVPSSLFIMEEDARILDYNNAASQLLGIEARMVVGMRSGEALHCIRAYENPEGCGKSKFCADCIIRNSVSKSLSGAGVIRQKTKMELKSEDSTLTVHMLVTTSPLRHEGQDMVVLEDITEFVELKDIIPICSYCKKIRDDKDYWQSLENYLKKKKDIDFSHGICPECYIKYVDN